MAVNLDFSIILPVCHGGPFLRDALQSLCDLDYGKDRFEVLVSADCNDNTARVIVDEIVHKNDVNVQYIETNGSNRSVKLNAACNRAGGTTLVFGDDDCVFYRDWLDKFRSFFYSNPEAGAVGGVDEWIQNESAFDLALDYVLNSFYGTGGLRGGRGLRTGKYYPKLWNMAIPKQICLDLALGIENHKIHVFHEGLDVHEDVELAHRIEQSGKGIFFSPDIKVKHARDTDYLSFAGRNYQMAKISRQLGTHGLPHWILSMFCMGVTLFPMITLSLGRIVFPFGVLMNAYLILLAAAFLGCISRTRRIKPSLLVPLLLFTLHYTRGLGFLLSRQSDQALMPADISETGYYKNG